MATNRAWSFARRLSRLVSAFVLTLGVLSAQGGRAANDKAVEVSGAVGHAMGQGLHAQVLPVLDVAIDELLVRGIAEQFLAMLLIQRAEVHRYLRHLEQAQADLQRAEDLLGRTERGRILWAEVYGIRGQIALDKGIVDVAAAELQRARAVVDEVYVAGQPYPIEGYLADRREAHLRMAREDFHGVVRHVQSRLDDPVYDAPEGTLHAATLASLMGYSLAELEQADPKRPPRAEQVLQDALARLSPLQSLRPLLWLADMALRRGADSLCQERLGAVEALLADIHPEGAEGFHPDRCVWTALSAHRARTTGATAQEPGAWLERLIEQRRAFETEWLGRPLRSGGHGPLLFYDVQDLLNELVAYELARDAGPAGQRKAVEHVARLQAVGSLARRLEAPVPSLDEIRDEILRDDPGHGLLLYLPGSQESRLLLVDTQSVDVALLARDDVLEWSRRELVRSIVRPRASVSLEDERHLRDDLAQLLWPEEVRERLAGWSHWTVVDADLLGVVPFEMLPFGDGLLGTQRAVDSLPSLPVGLALARRGPSADTAVDARLFVAPQPSPAALALDDELVPLPLDEVRAAALLAPALGGTLETLVGDEATSAALGAAPDENRARVWQFICHGVADRADERPMALAIRAGPGHDGLLRAADVEALDAPELVVVTACRAGHAPRRRGDPGAADLGGAFLLAGARAVILSDWDLELETVLRLSTVFHAALREGATPSEALRQARAELMTDPRFADPVLIGSLRLVGLGGVPMYPRDVPPSER